MIINNQHEICIRSFPEVKMGYEMLKSADSVKYLEHICQTFSSNKNTSIDNGVQGRREIRKGGWQA